MRRGIGEFLREPTTCAWRGPCHAGHLDQHTRPAGIPLRPDPDVLTRRGARALTRACFAHARHAFEPHGGASLEQIAQTFWPDDGATLSVLKAASSPAQTTGWGS